MEATGVCKSWKKEIDASSEPSRVFEMKVEGDQLAEGIEALNRRSRNSVQAVILKVENKLNQSEKNRLGGAISISSQSLKTMTIHHQGDLCKLVVEIAERCPNLKVLCSYRLGFENTLSTPSDRYGVLSFSPSWTASLETYCWKAGIDNLKCDPALLEHLRHAKDFTISIRDLTSRCIVELLSSNSDLADVKLRGGKDEAVETIPTMPLTNLENHLDGFSSSIRRVEGFQHLLRSAGHTESSKPSNLQSGTGCSRLSSFHFQSEVSLNCNDQFSNDQSAQDSTSLLVRAMKGRTKLESSIEAPRLDGSSLDACGLLEADPQRADSS